MDVTLCHASSSVTKQTFSAEFITTSNASAKTLQGSGSKK